MRRVHVASWRRNHVSMVVGISRRIFIATNELPLHDAGSGFGFVGQQQPVATKLAMTLNLGFDIRGLLARSRLTSPRP
jgi:hypothetical protein